MIIDVQFLLKPKEQLTSYFSYALEFQGYHLSATEECKWGKYKNLTAN